MSPKLSKISQSGHTDYEQEACTTDLSKSGQKRSNKKINKTFRVELLIWRQCDQKKIAKCL